MTTSNAWNAAIAKVEYLLYGYADGHVSKKSLLRGAAHLEELAKNGPPVIRRSMLKLAHHYKRSTTRLIHLDERARRAKRAAL